jgi:hypothetical protein
MENEIKNILGKFKTDYGKNPFIDTVIENKVLGKSEKVRLVEPEFLKYIVGKYLTMQKEIIAIIPDDVKNRIKVKENAPAKVSGGGKLAGVLG